MRKKSPIKKKPATRRNKAAAKKVEHRRCQTRARKRECIKAPAEIVSVAAAPVVKTPAAAPKPAERPPMPVELARMLEEETWWRVVPVRAVKSTVRVFKTKTPLAISKVRSCVAPRKVAQR